MSFCLSLLLTVGCIDADVQIDDPLDAVGDTAAQDTAGLTYPDINASPAVLVTSPSPGTIISIGESVRLVGQVSDDRDAAPDLICTWRSDLDGILGQTVALEGGLAQLVVDDLSVGHHNLTLEAIDSDGMRGVAQGVLVVNGPPTAPTIAIEPPSPTADDDLVAQITAASTDPNRAESNLVVEWRWTRDGEVMADLNADVVPAARTSPGEIWSVRVRAFDGQTFGPESQVSVTIDTASREAP